MTHPDADLAMQAADRVRLALEALADADEAAALLQVNEAGDAETRWMVSVLLGVVGLTATQVADFSSGRTTKSALLRALAAEVVEDAPRTGAAVVIEEAMRREGLI